MRARSIKPGFFKNEELAKLHPLTRLLFEGLWCMADRAGRLEDRPARIKIEVLPYDKCNVGQMLDSLSSAGFIERYVVNGTQFIQITAFLKHQSPHFKEGQSTIPPSIIVGTTEPEASPVLAPDKHQTSPVVAALTPDSGLLTADSGLLTACTPEPDQGPDAPAPDALVIVWNEEVRKPLSAARMTAERRERAYELLKQNPNLGYWRDVIQRIMATQVCHKWASFDWFLKPDTHVKVLEGNYDERPARASPKNSKTAGNAESFRNFVNAGKEVLT